MFITTHLTPRLLDTPVFKIVSQTISVAPFI